MANFHGLVLLCLLSLVTMAAATQFKVGGSMGWTVSTDPHSMSFNQWAQKHRFHVGDSLLFVYRPDKDSVLLVNNDDYNNCNTSSYIDKFGDGNTVFTLNQPGVFHFISGVEANCIKNESLIVMVMGDRSNKSSVVSLPLSSPPSPPLPSATPPPPGSVEVTPPTLPSPTPPGSVQVTPPPPSPTPPPPGSVEVTPPSPPSPTPPGSVEVTPSPSPPSPTPPPPGSVEATPSSGPTGAESTSPNGASLKVVGFMGSIGAFLGSFFLLL